MELTELNSNLTGQSHFFAASQLKTIESTLLGILVDLCEYTNAIQFFFFLETGEREPVDKHLRPAIPPSCNYSADHLSVRSLSVTQFRAIQGKLTGNEWCLAPSENRVKWSATLIVYFAKNRCAPVREL